MTSHGPHQPDTQVNDAALLRRIADTVAIMLYEMEVLPDGSFNCHEFVGLEALIGPLPDGMTPDDAYNAAVHPDDREAYDGASVALHEGRPVEVEYRLTAADGSVRWVLDRMRPTTSSDGHLLVGGVVADITDRKQAELELFEANRKRAELELRETQRLAHIALHDALTGLPNRVAIQEHLELALRRAERSAAAVALMFIDLDHFKCINDSFGHAAGDELLRAVATRLREAVRNTDVVARQGGDEFLILLPDLSRETPDSQEAPSSPVVKVAAKIHAALRSPFLVEGIETVVSASIGISLYPDHAADAGTLIKHADFAMYRAKEEGRDGHALYARAVDSRSSRSRGRAGYDRRSRTAGRHAA
ncbi:MAG TPA: diguanylate cyclase [Solirubrobacteraceae bacterium]|jgi:diguanylate cyclase (GGDEF)-like protein|nr:diguanylate cyclase [Solirubrobacteraceae bacterium]